MNGILQAAVHIMMTLHTQQLLQTGQIPHLAAVASSHEAPAIMRGFQALDVAGGRYHSLSGQPALGPLGSAHVEQEHSAPGSRCHQVGIARHPCQVPQG